VTSLYSVDLRSMTRQLLLMGSLVALNVISPVQNIIEGWT